MSPGLCFDVLVAGGGPAGSITALELSRRGLSVALIEQDDYESFRVGETLPPLIRPKLTALDLWEPFLASEPLQSYGIQSAWESATPRRQDFVRNAYGSGWHVNRAGFDRLLANAAAQAGAKLFRSTRVNSFQKSANDRSRLECVQGGHTLTLTGWMLVDATGRRARLAATFGARAHFADHLIGAVSIAERHDLEQWTLIEAVADGWWYSAPIPGGRMVFTYMTDSDLWKAAFRLPASNGTTNGPDSPGFSHSRLRTELRASSNCFPGSRREATWGDLVRAAPLTLQRAGGIDVPLPVIVHSAASFIRQPAAGPGWLAVGDAALAFDPLSGEGVLKSIDTAIHGAAAIARSLEGDSASLAEYDARVKQTYDAYLATRAQFYRSVARWPASRFWARRAAA